MKRVVPGLGEVTRVAHGSSYESQPIKVPMLGSSCRFLLEGYEHEDDVRRSDFHAAIDTILVASRVLLDGAAPFIFEYYRDCVAHGHAALPIASPEDVWAHVELGNELAVSRARDGRVYVSLAGSCAWEEEHGIQLVFAASGEVVKVGMFDGHLTNVEAFGDDTLEGVVCVRMP